MNKNCPFCRTSMKSGVIGRTSVPYQESVKTYEHVTVTRNKGDYHNPVFVTQTEMLGSYKGETETRYANYEYNFIECSRCNYKT